MRTGRGLSTAAIALVLATGCGGEEPEPEATAPPSPEGVTSCLDERDIAVRRRATPSWGAVVELRAAEESPAGAGVSVLFYEDEGGASGGANTLRIAGEPAARVGNVLVILGGPGFEDVDDAVLECLGVEPAPPVP